MGAKLLTTVLVSMFSSVLLSAVTIRTSHASVPIHLEFSYEVDEGIPLIVDSVGYQNSIGENYSVTRLDWLATDFELTDESGKITQVPDSTMFINGDGASFNLAKFRGKKITAISFNIGPDPKINHSDPSQYHARHPLNPSVNNLHWDWQSGYIFLAIEGHWQSFGKEGNGGYSYHFANDANRTKITLPLNFSPSKESRIGIALDVGKLLEDLSFADDGATTHSRPDDPVASRLKINLQSAFRIVNVHNGSFLPPPEAVIGPIDLPAHPVDYVLNIPKHVPQPLLPEDNPLIVSRVALGDKLFHEPKLSRDNTISCVSCHTGKTLSDSRKLSVGIDGKLSRRHSMPLFNLAWKNRFFWDGRAASLREQVIIPIEDPQEMNESIENVMRKLIEDPVYPSLFAAAFGTGDISPENIGLALEAFLLTRFSFDAKIDQSVHGDSSLTVQEQRGFELFFTEYEPRLGKRGADCFHCHGGALFTNHSFNNNGLATTDDIGLEQTTGRASDRYKFSTPSLRNIALTAPYMHDGRFDTLEEVVEHYDNGVQKSDTLDPNIAKHPGGLALSQDDKEALVAFLKTLSDTTDE